MAREPSDIYLPASDENTVKMDNSSLSEDPGGEAHHYLETLLHDHLGAVMNACQAKPPLPHYPYDIQYRI